MPKVLPQNIDQEIYDPEVWEFGYVGHSDWTDWDQHPWEWYVERDARLSEGWHLVTINASHKDVTVIYYLKSLEAKFKYSGNEFLIKDGKDATMVALKYA